MKNKIRWLNKQTTIIRGEIMFKFEIKAIVTKTIFDIS